MVLEGKGLHSGNHTTVIFRPARANTGIIFIRTDVSPAVKIPAHTKYARSEKLCSVVQNKGLKVKTIEHLMASINALGIDNLLIEIDKSEVPILDGSSKEFFHILQKAGITKLAESKKFIRILKPIRVELGGRKAALLPSSSSSFSFQIDFSCKNIGKQSFEFNFSKQDFKKELCSARTFGFEKDVIKLRRAGFIRGGSVKNAILINDEGKVMNKEGLRFKDELVRHKLLDSIGDIALAGYRILGHYDAVKSGHALNHALLQKLFKSQMSWSLVDAVSVAKRSVA